MFSYIRKRATAANIAAVIALVFATAGGAVASSGGSRLSTATKHVVVANGKTASRKYIITSTSQVKPSVLKALHGLSGPTGPAGPAGPSGVRGETGTAGFAGKNGTDGTNGTNGTAGESVTVKELAKGSAQCAEGGVEVSNKAGAGHACNGSAASGGYVEKLPSGKTEAGTWNLLSASQASDKGTVVISFPVPVAISAGHVKFFKEGGGETTECKGTAEEPSAEAGYLCIYTEIEGGGPALSGNVLAVKSSAGAIGAEWSMSASEPSGHAWGTWAVTAE